MVMSGLTCARLARAPLALVGAAAAALLPSVTIHAAGTQFLRTPSGGMQCAAQAAPVLGSNHTVWICTGTVATNDVNEGMSAGILEIQAMSTPSAATNCGPTATNEDFSVTYQDAFGSVTNAAGVDTISYQQSGSVCQTRYGSRTTAIAMAGTGSYVGIDELCQFSVSGPLNSADTGAPVVTFSMDSGTGCTPLG